MALSANHTYPRSSFGLRIDWKQFPVEVFAALVVAELLPRPLGYAWYAAIPLYLWARYLPVEVAKMPTFWGGVVRRMEGKGEQTAMDHAIDKGITGAATITTRIAGGNENAVREESPVINWLAARSVSGLFLPVAAVTLAASKRTNLRPRQPEVAE